MDWLLSLLPYAFFLLCPLMMLFMHRGHGGGHDHTPDAHAAHHEAGPELTPRAGASGDEVKS